MIQPVYISAASAISPQHSFGTDAPLQPVMSSDNGRLFVRDADYSQFINPVAIRRMSRMLKMGISTGMDCLRQSGIEKPDGIITGTGRGSMRDMEIFLGDMLRLKEEALNPTYFIQSTYNSINGWLALQTKCTGYNQTYVHRGHSLEMALLDAQLLLNETTDKQHYLVGSFDEMTDEYFGVKSKIGYWKQPTPHSLHLYKHSDTPGSIGGEGSAFFMVTNEKENALFSIAAMQMLQDYTPAEVDATIARILEENKILLRDVDVILCGMSGDSRFDGIYKPLFNNTTVHTTVGAFKHLCGEYDTSTGFAMWLAAQAFKTQQVPDAIILKKGVNPSVKTVLIVNHYILNSASVMLLRANS